MSGGICTCLSVGCRSKIVFYIFYFFNYFRIEMLVAFPAAKEVLVLAHNFSL